MKKISKTLYFLFFFLLFLTGCGEETTNPPVINKLDTPTNIELLYDIEKEELTIDFDLVNGATLYKAYFYRNSSVIKTIEVTKGSIIRDLPLGTYIVEVQAFNDNNESSEISSSNKLVTIKKISMISLSSPTNLTAVYSSVDKKVYISFDKNISAIGYKLYIYKEENNESNLFNEMDIKSGDSLSLQSGDYTFKVKAMGNNIDYTDSSLSSFSNKISITTEEIITNLESIRFIGLDKEAVPYGTQRHVLQGIRVVGNDGITYPVKVTYSTNIDLVNETIPKEYSGKVIINYFAEYKGLKTTGTKIVIVLDESGLIEGENVIKNGDFSNGLSDWILSNHEGASSEISIVDDTLKVDLYALNYSNASSPRLNSASFTLETGKTYTVEFTAWAESSKTIQVQVGELFNTSPWFLNYTGLDPVIFIITPEKNTYSFSFTYDRENSSNIMLLFEMGIVNGNVTKTTVFYDDISIKSTNLITRDLVIPSLNVNKEEIIYVNQKVAFDPLKNVMAFDLVDGDLTSRITYEIKQNNVRVNEIDQTREGEYDIFYNVMDNSYNQVQKITHVIIKEIDYDSDNLLVNGSFDEGIKGWQVVTHEGGFATGTVENGLFKVQMTGINWNDNSSSPRLNNFIPFTLIEGEAYKVSFDAKADETKTILVQIGELYEMSPYWFNMKEESIQTFSLGKELNHFEFIFVNKSKNTNRGFVTFEMGVVEEDNIITNVYYDNIKVELLDYEVGDYLSPIINNLKDKYYFKNEIEFFNPLDGITAIDDIDNDLTSSIEYKIYLNQSEVDKVDTTIENTYEIMYIVKDKSNNLTQKSIKVHILKPLDEIDNLLNNTTWNKNSEGVEDFEITTIENGVKMVSGDDGGTNTWDVRVTTQSILISNGAEYTIYFDLVSSISRNILVQVGNYANTSDFTVQYSKVIKVSTQKERYMISFIASASGTFALGLEMGPGDTYPYVKSEIEITNVIMAKGKTYLKTPEGVVLNPIPGGYVLAFAATYTGNVSFKLYVYDSNNKLINGAPFTVYNGQPLNDLNIPQGTYTIKIQAVGRTSDVEDSQLTKGFTYTR